MNYSDWQMYHIYPLRCFGCPDTNDFNSKPRFEFNKILEWIPHLKNLKINAIYFGPIFESFSHGYDTRDYYTIDRRLGTKESVQDIFEQLHQNGFKIIVDGVFNHTGRHFWAFEDIQKFGHQSQYKEWYASINFDSRSPYNDNFSYLGWNGHYNLVKLNLLNPYVKQHLFGAVKIWIEELNIDGIRFDACDELDMGFLRELSSFCREIKPNIWLMGEIIHGDYRRWANPQTLNSVTNYECYKGLWSSFNDINLFEISYSLNRQFGDYGLYRNIATYNFADNHDVPRVASSLKNKSHLYPLYIILYTMPGIPSIYYGSEWGIYGEKGGINDNELRPSIDINNIDYLYQNFLHRDLIETLILLANIRCENSALKYGNYQNLYISPLQMAFMRNYDERKILIIINGASEESEIKLPFNFTGYDLLNREEIHYSNSNKIKIYSFWGRIIKIY